jgi:tetratricopeptide (TPR) repeat protein
VLVRKDFYAFEPYLVGQYEALAARGAFGPRHQPYKTGLLYMIAQTQYRNRKFAASLARLGELRGALAESSKADQQHLGPRCTLLWAMNHVYLGKNDEAVAVLEKVLEGGEADDWPVAQLLNARINLAFCYFQRGDYARANRLLLAAGHSDRWNNKKMGLEWTLRKNLSEIIIQYELGNVDLVLNKVRAIERNFDALLRSPVYANVRTYLQFIRQLVDDPGAAADKAFSAEVDRTFRFLPVEQEDLQAMSFYAWLKSKMLRRDYYSVLLELVA